MTRHEVGDEFELELGGPAHGGFMVGREDGRVGFVRYGLPGERVRVRVTEDRGGSFFRADATEVLSAHAGRRESVCPIAGPGGSGCCDFAFASPELLRAIKTDVLTEQLRRITRIDAEVPVAALPGGDTGWRTRVRLGVDASGRAGFRRSRSEALVTDLACPQASPEIYRGIDEALAERGGVRAGSEVHAVIGDDGAHAAVLVDPPRFSGKARRDRGRRGAISRREAEAAPRAEHALLGGSTVLRRLGSREFRLSATGFWQAHRSGAQTYVDVVSRWFSTGALAVRPGDRAWDLYGGVGVFASALAAMVGDTGAVDSVEMSRTATVEGATNLADLPRVDFHAGRVDRVARTLAAPDVVLLDPPRSGAGKEVLAVVTEAAPRQVVQVGCDPAAFARDVRLLLDAGYRIDAMEAFDAYPLTHHLEAVALLSR